MSTNSNHPSLQNRGSSGRLVKSVDSADKAAAAAELRRQGRTYDQIAAELGYADRSGAWRAVATARAEVIREPAEGLIAVEKAELDRLYLAAMEVLERDHIHVSNGRVVRDADGTPILDDGPKLAAINAARQVRESYRKLTGLDQPAKQEISGGVKYEVVGVSTEDLT